MNGELFLGIDISDDIACLCVTVRDRDTLKVINIFYDKEAKELYKKLTEKDGNKNE